MRPADYPEALERAAAPVLRAIEEDKRRAPRRLWPLFDEILERFFEPDLDRHGIQWGAGFDDPEVFSDLRQELGQPAWSYIRGGRLETAARLLLETLIPLSEIARMVGWSSPTTFRGTLGEFLQMRPSEYRRLAPRLFERVGPPPAGAERREYWERMLAGDLTGDEARALDAWLQRLAPGSASSPGGDDRGPSCVGSWPSSSPTPSSPCPSPSSAGWSATRWRSPATPSSRRSAGAEEDLERSASEFARAFEEGKPVVLPLWEAERGRVEAAFHWLRGRRLEALPALDRSVVSCQVSGGGEPPRALILRAELSASIADLRIDTGGVHPELVPRTRLSSALADVEEARSRLAESPPGEQAAALALWVRILVLRGDRGESLAALPEVRRWASALDDLAAGLVPWLEGHCAAEPETLWGEARERFAARGDELAAARATLDLARYYLDRGRADDAIAEAARLASALGAHAASREDLSALEALDRPAADAGPAAGVPVAGEDLDAAEGVLRRLEWDRRAQRALELAL